MSVKRDATEFDLWPQATPAQRSFLVEVLHWFHYRTTALKSSWSREEVLTWELFRALELLPQEQFLRPLVTVLGTLSDDAAAAAEVLLKSEPIDVVAYPSLQLSGSKRNCRADVGFGVAGVQHIWLEAKTGPCSSKDLALQIEQQRTSLTTITPAGPTAVVALLPSGMPFDEGPLITWNSVALLFQSGIDLLRCAVPVVDVRRGYERIATEFLDRVTSHPNSIVDGRA